jgi:hypothetical protein
MAMAVSPANYRMSLGEKAMLAKRVALAKLTCLGVLALKSLYLAAAVTTACCLGGCALLSAWLDGLYEKPHEIVVRDRTEAEYLAVATTAQTIGSGSIPTSWDTGVFISAATLRRLSQRFEGLTITHTQDGTALAGARTTIKKFEVTPQVGAMTGVMTMASHSDAIDLDLDFTIEAVAEYSQTIPSKDSSTTTIVFKWMPTRIAPGLKWGPLSIAATGFASELLAEAAIYFADASQLQVTVNIPTSVSLPLGPIAEVTRTPPGSAGGTITYSTALPRSQITERFELSPPVFTDHGIWLVSRRSDNNAPPPLSIQLPVATTTDQLAAQIRQLRTVIATSLATVQTPATDLQVYVSSGALQNLVLDVNSLSVQKRTVIYEVTSHDGHLADAELSDPRLGSIGVYAELASDHDTHGSVVINSLSAWWDNGLHASAQVTGSAEGSIKLQFIVPGGSYGRLFRFVGNTPPSNVALDAAFGMFRVDSYSAATMWLEPRCSDIAISIRNEPNAQLDWGWIVVPGFGAIVHVLVFTQPQAPIVLFDSRPHFVNLLPPDQASWRFDHPTPYAKDAIVPVSVVTDNNGVRIAADAALKAVLSDSSPASRMAAEDTVARESDDLTTRAAAALAPRNVGAVVNTGTIIGADTGLWPPYPPRLITQIPDIFKDVGVTRTNKPSPQTCPAQGPVEITLFDFKFGPNNDVVKFLVNELNDVLNGPGDNNDLVRAGAYVGMVLYKIGIPQLTKAVLDPLEKQMENLAPNSPVVAATKTVVEFAEGFAANPAKALGDVPKDLGTEVQDVWKEVQGNPLVNPVGAVISNACLANLWGAGCDQGNGRPCVLPYCKPCRPQYGC